MATPKKAPILEASPDLGEFDGVPITEVRAAFRGGGDSFSEAMAIRPRLHYTGDAAYWVVKTVTGPIDHDPLDDEAKKIKSKELPGADVDSYRRVEDQLFVQVIEVDESAVLSWLNESAAEVAKVKAEREEREREAALVKAEADALAAEAEAGVMRLVPPAEA